jgi:hypothetical protein
LSSRLLSINVNIKIYRTIILPVVLYGCETWSLTLRNKNRLRIFDKMIGRLFGPKREEVKENWRKMHNEKLHNLFSSPYFIVMTKSRRISLVRHVACVGEMGTARKI